MTTSQFSCCIRLLIRGHESKHDQREIFGTLGMISVVRNVGLEQKLWYMITIKICVAGGSIIFYYCKTNLCVEHHRRL